MKFLNVLKSDIEKICFNKVYIISILTIVIMYFISVIEEIHSITYVVYLYFTTIINQESAMVFVIAVVPVVKVLYDETRDNAYINTIMRVGRLNYYISKCVSFFLCTAMLIVIAHLLYILMWSCFFPTVTAYSWDEPGVDSSGILRLFGELLTPVQFFVLHILSRALGAGFLAVISLLLSSVTKNIFALLGTPILVYNLTDRTLFHHLIIGQVNSDTFGMDILSRTSFFLTLFIITSVVYCVVMNYKEV